MKKFSKSLLLILLCFTLVVTAGCSKVDEDYGVSSAPKSTADTVSYPENVEIPTIKSSDTVMPLYFDISLYDEENYSKIYLGKNYSFKASYAGVNISVPTTLNELNKKGFDIYDDNYSSGSDIKAGLMLELKFVNREGKLLTAFFHNESTTSVRIADCKIVRLAVEQNNMLTNSKEYGNFSVNGVTNSSALTDIFHLLGAPSHFHADSKTDYTLNWFKSADDRRNKITIKISTAEDCVTYIAVSSYE